MILTRRDFLQAAGAAGLTAFTPGLGAAGSVRELTLRSAATTASLAGGSYPPTPVWSYGGRVPGPEIRIRHGERLRVTLDNALEVATTVHWHGIRIPNAMDGVPGLTQRPVSPGSQFVYEFTPPDAGTFWYHPHVRSFEQVDRGLAGALVVEESEPVPVDRDVIWMLDDWRLTRDAAISETFGAGHDLSHAGRLGNTVTINGRVTDRFEVRSGERIRLRLINVANARNFALSFEGHTPTIIAIDGQPVEPHEPHDGVFVLGAAMRMDLLLDCNEAEGHSARVVDEFYAQSTYRLTELVYVGSVERSRAKDEDIAIKTTNPLPEPDIEKADRHTIALSGGAMGRMRGARLDDQWADMRTLMRNGLVWAMGGVARRPTSDAAPVLVAQRGSSHVVSMRNETAFPHPMHLHGHHFRVLARNGNPTRYREWQDTVLVMPRESVEIAFNADNPGEWLFHCHVLEHHAAGMSAVVRVT